MDFLISQVEAIMLIDRSSLYLLEQETRHNPTFLCYSHRLV